MTLNLNVKYATVADVDALYEVEKVAWGEGGASKEVLKERILTPGDYTILLTDDQDEIICFTQVKKLFENQIAKTACNWYSLMDLIPDTNGDYLFGYNLSGKKVNANLSLGINALEATYASVLDLQCKCLFAGGRMINYEKWEKYDIKPELYPSLIQKKNTLFYTDHKFNLFEVGTIDNSRKQIEWLDLQNITQINPLQAKNILAECKSIDTIINIYRNAALVGKRAEFIGVVANYFSDKKSIDYGLLYVWTNPFLSEKNKAADFLKKSFQYIPITRFK